MFKIFSKSNEPVNSVDPPLPPASAYVADAKFGNYCYGSRFAVDADAHITNQRYIERTGKESWSYMEMGIRPNTEPGTNAASFLQPVCEYTVLAKDVSFGHALQQLHNYEAGALLLNPVVELPAESYPENLYYKKFALREGLIFDTKHRLNGSVDGRPKPFHAGAQFLQSDVDALANEHKTPAPQDYMAAIKCSNTFQLLEKAMDSRSTSERLTVAAQRFRNVLSNPNDYSSDKNKYKHTGREASKYIRSAIEEDPSLKDDDVLASGSQIISLFSDVYILRHKITQNCTTSYRSGLNDILESCNSFDPNLEDMREFFMCILVSDEYSKQVLETLKPVADNWVAQKPVKNPVEPPNAGQLSGSEAMMERLTNFVDHAVHVTQASERNAEIAKNVYFHVVTRKPQA